MDYVIELRQVTQTFVSSDGSPVTALQTVDLGLRRHEFVSIIGPSGCGKSTILRLIAGLLRPSGGQVSIFGVPVTEPRDEMSFELLRIWGERPKTVVFVTHSIQEALLLSDRIVVMSARPGRVAEIIDVPLPRPRQLATLSDPVFTQLANDIRVKVFSRKPE